MLSDPSDSRTGSAPAHAFANYYRLQTKAEHEGCVKFEGDVGSRQERGLKPALATEHRHRPSQLDLAAAISPRLPPFLLLLPLLLAAPGCCYRRWLLLLLLLLAVAAVG